MSHVTKNYSTEGGDALVIGGKLVIEEGAEVEGLGGGGGEEYTLPVASADILGGVKIGDGLTITEGVLSVDGITPAETQAALGNDAALEDVVIAFNALLAALKAAGIVAEETVAET